MTAAAGGQADDYFPDTVTCRYDVATTTCGPRYQVDSNQLDGRAVLDAVALDGSRRAASRPARALGPQGQRRRRRPSRSSPPRAASSSSARASRSRPGEKFRLSVSYGGRPAPVPGRRRRERVGGARRRRDRRRPDHTALRRGSPATTGRATRRATHRPSRCPTTTTSSANGTLDRSAAAVPARRPGSTSSPSRWRRTWRRCRSAATSNARSRASPVPMRAVLPPAARRRLRPARSAGSRRCSTFFARLFGPYPFAVVHASWSRRTSWRSRSRRRGCRSSARTSSTDDWDAVRLVAHELSHQWFGNSLTADRRGATSGCTRASPATRVAVVGGVGPGIGATNGRVEHWNGSPTSRRTSMLGDPGPDDMFDDRVYKRGALLLHALRLTARRRHVLRAARDLGRAQRPRLGDDSRCSSTSPRSSLVRSWGSSSTDGCGSRSCRSCRLGHELGPCGRQDGDGERVAGTSVDVVQPRGRGRRVGCLPGQQRRRLPGLGEPDGGRVDAQALTGRLEQRLLAHPRAGPLPDATGTLGWVQDHSGEAVEVRGSTSLDVHADRADHGPGHHRHVVATGKADERRRAMRPRRHAWTAVQRAAAPSTHPGDVDRARIDAVLPAELLTEHPIPGNPARVPSDEKHGALQTLRTAHSQSTASRTSLARLSACAISTP